MISKIKLIISEIIHKINYLPKKDENFLINKIINQIKVKGYYKIPSFLDEKECDLLIEKYIAFAKNNPEKVSVESNGCDNRIYGIDRFDKSFYIDKVNEIGDAVFNKFSFKNSSDHFTLFGNIISGEKNLGSGSGWHRDSPFRHQFKTIIYLSDVEEENGPFEYIEKSHTYSNVLKTGKHLKKKLNDFRFSNDEINKAINASSQLKSIKFTAPKGTLLFVDVRGLHRGAPLQKGERFAITRYYMSSNSKKFIK